MKRSRRKLLLQLGATGSVALAGCSSFGGGQETTETESSDDTPSTGSTETPADPSQDVTETEVSTTTTEAETKSFTWRKWARFNGSDDTPGDQFGSAVSVSDDGTTAIAGAPGENKPYGENAGAAYIFVGSTNAWKQTAKLIPDDSDSGDRLGRSVSISADGTTVLVGAPADEGPDGKKTGAAYIFEQAEDSWKQRAKLIADGSAPGDGFGNPVSLSGDGTVAIVGAVGASGDINEVASDLSGPGVAYVFEGSGNAWNQRAKLTPTDRRSHDRFGSSISVSADGTTALIGSFGDNANGQGSGAAYLFDGSGGSWRQQAKLTPSDGDSRDAFGKSVGMSSDGTTAVIGAWGDEHPNGGGSGSAYIFDASDGSWRQQAKLTANDGDIGDLFGNAVAISDERNTVFIGAWHDKNANGEEAGAVYVFDQSDRSWQQRTKIMPSNGITKDMFGNDVAISGDGKTALVGAFRSDVEGTDSGTGHVFKLMEDR